MATSKRRRVLAESGGGLLVAAPDVYGSSKRAREVELDRGVSSAEADGIPSDAHAAVLLVLSELDSVLGRGFPRVLLKHQLYTVVGDRTLADQQLETLRRAGDVLLFKLGSVGEEDTAIMLTSDYRELVTTALPTAELAASFLGIATDSSHGLTLTKAELVGVDGIEEEDIKVLLRVGCVAMRDASSFWLSFPRTGVLLQSLRAGREQIVRTVRNAKFKEILQRDLLKRRLKSTGLPIRYLISDAVGRGALTLTHTTSGPLLRIAPGAID